MIRDGEQVQHTGYTTDLITDFSIEWLKNRDKTKPFLLMSQHKAPHREWAPALRHLGWNGDREFPEPETLFDDYSGRGRAEHEQDMTLEKTFTDRDAKLAAPPYLNDEQRRRGMPTTSRATRSSGRPICPAKTSSAGATSATCTTTSARVKAVDEAVGRLLQYLDDEGLAENTLVIFSSDQGFYLGEHGWFDKRWIYEESLTTPLLVRWPGVTKPGGRCKALVSDSRFAGDLPRGRRPAGSAGHAGRAACVPLLRGETPADWRTSFYYHYYEFPGVHSVPRHYGVVTDRYKLFHFYEPEMNYWTLIDREKRPPRVEERLRRLGLRPHAPHCTPNWRGCARTQGAGHGPARFQGAIRHKSRREKRAKAGQNPNNELNQKGR